MGRGANALSAIHCISRAAAVDSGEQLKQVKCLPIYIQ
jgi:hypothetical protein